jgi:predicted nucleotidyltransferase
MIVARGQAQAERQIAAVLALIDAVMGEDALGIYLYGSSMMGGLQKYSDIDLMVISTRPTTREEKQRLARHLLTISGVDPDAAARPIELTIVAHSEVQPWRYPPRFDFQYGDWMRREFEAGEVEPWATTVCPDLALLLTQVMIAGTALVGPPASTLLEPVPYHDFMTATLSELDRLLLDLDADTRNVLLTLARIWCTVETETIRSKQDAAAWALRRLPPEPRPALARARAIYLGEAPDRWQDVAPLVRPCADLLVTRIKGRANPLDLRAEGRSITRIDA